MLLYFVIVKLGIVGIPISEIFIDRNQTVLKRIAGAPIDVIKAYRREIISSLSA